VAKEMDIFTIVAVPLQIPLKEHIAFNIAYRRVKNLLSLTDNCIVVTNQSYTENNIKTNEVYEKINQILAKIIKSIIGVIIEPAFICIDFADVRTVLQNGGLSLVGLGSAGGENKIEEAINRAIKSISLQGKNIPDASKLLVVFYSDEDITLKDIDFAMQKIENELSGNNLAVFDAILNTDTDKFEVVIIATVFEKNSYSKKI
jgi:cell division protein FtsZ